jgi:hypothetical protein
MKIVNDKTYNLYLKILFILLAIDIAMISFFIIRLYKITHHGC